MSCDRARSLDLTAFLVEPGSAEFEAFRAHYPTCHDCSRAVERLSRLESAMRAEASAAAHPDARELLALEREPETLPAPRRDALSDHLAGCAPCRAELRALRGFDFGALREATQGPARMRRREGRAPPPRRRASRTTVAAAVAALLILGLLPLLLLRKPGSVEPSVAVSEPEPAAGVEMEPVPAAAPPSTETRIAAEPAPEAIAEPVRREPLRVAAQEEPPPPDVPVAGEEAPEPEPVEVAMAPSEPLHYAPPGASDPRLRHWRVPGVVRSGAAHALRIQALAPDHTGLTTRASPTLYWTLSGDTDLRVDLVVTDEVSVEPILDRALDGAEAGVHALDLAEHGVVLEPGKTYRWYATLVPDPEHRSSDVVSGGAIARIEPDADLTARLEAAAPGYRAHVLAESGLFYDALDVVSRWIAERPDAPEPRRDRAALLEAVGLGKAIPAEGDPPQAG